jgi:hypothetical protein
MTKFEFEVFSELTYCANEIVHCMATHPDLTARQIAGTVADPDDELARFARAITAARKILSPWLFDADGKEITS